MKKFLSICLGLSALCVLFALSHVTMCGAAPSMSEASVKFTDALNREVVIDETPQVVVSLMGSFAETWTLAGGELSGVTIDAVEERNMDLGPTVRIVGSVKTPNLEEILDVDPDLVIMSADIDGHVKAISVLEKAGITCAAFKVEVFSDYLNMLKLFTQITGRNDLYQKNGVAVGKEIERVVSKVTDCVSRPTVLFLRAFSTGAKAKSDDNMTGAMLKDLNTDNIASRHTSLLESISMEEVIMEDPDYIFVVTMGSDSQKALDALKKGIQSNPAWNRLSAVRNGRYIVLPRELFHYKPNARWGEAYEYLAEIIYPELFD